MSFRPINLDAFWKGSFSERYQLLNALIFLHDKKTEIEKAEKLAKNTTSTPLSTPSKTSNCNPPPIKRKTSAPSKEDEESDYEVIIHKVTIDSSDGEEDGGFIIHKQKKHTSFAPEKEKK